MASCFDDPGELFSFYLYLFVYWINKINPICIHFLKNQPWRNIIIKYTCTVWKKLFLYIKYNLMSYAIKIKIF